MPLLYSQRDFIVSGGLFLLTVVLCMLLRSVDPHGDTSYVAVLFFLDVFLTALLTDGYLFSILIAVAGVLCVDYIFTEPYWEISFTLAGFPLTFIVMMFISVAGDDEVPLGIQQSPVEDLAAFRPALRPADPVFLHMYTAFRRKLTPI